MSIEVGSKYRGWDVEHHALAPVTGRFAAQRHGVGMCAGSLQALGRMIDQRYKEEVRERHDRGGLGGYIPD